MALQTLDAFGKKIAKELGETWTQANKDQFLDWIQNAIEELYTVSRDWFFAFGEVELLTNPTTSTYDINALGADILRVFDVGSKREIPVKTESYALQKGYDLNAAGDPLICWPEGFNGATGKLQLRFWPIPTEEKTYQILINFDVSALTLVTAIPFPATFFPALRHRVKASYWESAENSDWYDKHYLLYNNKVKELKRRYSHLKRHRWVMSVGDLNTNDYEGTPQLGSNYPGVIF
jgi:hypothetical protein